MRAIVGRLDVLLATVFSRVLYRNLFDQEELRGVEYWSRVYSGKIKNSRGIYVCR